MEKTRHHSFDVELATLLGVEKAIIYGHLLFYLEAIRANGPDKSAYHVREGADGKKYYWTYMSGEAFVKIYPYFTRASISRWLRELEESGMIFSNSTFNKSKYDKTKWYTLPTFFCEETEPSIVQTEPSIVQNEQPIPVTIPNTISNIKKTSETKLSAKHRAQKAVNVRVSNSDSCSDMGKYPHTPLVKKTRGENPKKALAAFLDSPEKEEKTNVGGASTGGYTPLPPITSTIMGEINSGIAKSGISGNLTPKGGEERSAVGFGGKAHSVRELSSSAPSRAESGHDREPVPDRGKTKPQVVGCEEVQRILEEEKIDVKIREIFCEFWENRRLTKKGVNTRISLSKIITKVKAYTVAEVLSALTLSIENGWTTIYPKKFGGLPAYEDVAGEKTRTHQTIKL